MHLLVFIGFFYAPVKFSISTNLPRSFLFHVLLWIVWYEFMCVAFQLCYVVGAIVSARDWHINESAVYDRRLKLLQRVSNLWFTYCMRCYSVALMGAVLGRCYLKPIPSKLP